MEQEVTDRQHGHMGCVIIYIYMTPYMTREGSSFALHEGRGERDSRIRVSLSLLVNISFLNTSKSDSAIASGRGCEPGSGREFHPGFTEVLRGGLPRHLI